MNERDHVVRKVEQHLRKMTRKLVKIDSEEEALQYLSDTFRTQLYCDFVSVIFIEDEEYVPKVWSGNGEKMRNSFPLKIAKCNYSILQHSLTNEEVKDEVKKCNLFSLLEKNKVKTWFTVPIHNEVQRFGFCLIGFFEHVKLLKMSKHFDEFGKDLALAINLTRERETEVKKTEGIEWITQSLSIDSPFEKTIREITTRAGKGTRANFACIYLYNDLDNRFIYQSPSYGNISIKREVVLKEDDELINHFPHLDQVGGNELTTVIAMDIKIIGILHVKDKEVGQFNEDDLRTLQMLSNHLATNLENVRLYNSEKESHARLHFLLQYQQSLVKETIKYDSLDGITSMINKLFNDSLVLFDRFMRPISYKLVGDEYDYLEELSHKIAMARQSTNNFIKLHNLKFTFWPITSGNDLLGYLAIRMSKKELDEYDQLMIEMARNIYSIQFSKQKLVLDSTEQAKERFINKLINKNVNEESKESILQYANLFLWDLYQPHRVVQLAIVLAHEEIENCNLLDIQMKRETVWEYIKFLVIEKNSQILTSPLNDYYLLMVPDEKIKNLFWEELYKEIKNAIKKSGIKCDVFLGIGESTNDIHDYYKSSEQARQALNVVKKDSQGKHYELFESLGSYTVLQYIDEKDVIDLFITQQLGKLIKQSQENNMDLVQTLRVYLRMNGNAKATAEKLFLHRSSLLYRLDRIEDLLNINLSDSEVRFNLMLAFKLYDIHD